MSLHPWHKMSWDDMIMSRGDKFPHSGNGGELCPTYVPGSETMVTWHFAKTYTHVYLWYSAQGTTSMTQHSTSTCNWSALRNKLLGNYKWSHWRECDTKQCSMCKRVTKTCTVTQCSMCKRVSHKQLQWHKTEIQFQRALGSEVRYVINSW